MVEPVSSSLRGHMLKNRIITALLLGSVFLVALFGLPDLWWSLFLLVFIFVGAWEWCSLAAIKGASKVAFLGILMGTAFLLLPFATDLAPLRYKLSGMLTMSAAIFWLLLAPSWLSRRWRMPGQTLSLLTGLILLLPPWVALVDLRHTLGPANVLVLILVVVMADSAAYFSGKRFGKHKLAPEISPGKTWEGVAGALAAVFLFSTLLCLWKGWNLWLVVGFMALVVLSVIGDLFESMVKRQAGKKDSGTLLPGHGGVLDRIDGLTSTLPVAAFFTYFPFYIKVLFVS